MASRKVNILELSTRECSTESALNAGSTASDGGNIGPSAVHLDPTTDESLNENNRPSTTLLSCSHPQYSAIGVPVSANGRSIGPEEGGEQMADEGNTNACSRFLSCYRNTVNYFRNSCTFWDWYLKTIVKSCFIFFVHVLFSYIQVTTIFFGLMSLDKCPKASFLPIFVTVVGVVGVVFVGFWVAVCCCEHQHRRTPCAKRLKFALGMLLMLLLVLVVIELCLFGQLAPSFDSKSKDYCIETFYYYVIGKEILCAAAIIIAVLLNFPGSRIPTCCRNCSIPNPADAFYHGV